MNGIPFLEAYSANSTMDIPEARAALQRVPSMRDFIGNNLTFYIVSGKTDVVKVYGWSKDES